MPRTNRDDFTSATKEKAAKRVAYRCSFCGKPTIGPSSEKSDAISNTGVAAHICAAAPGGKRYDANMTPEQRMSINNCIWMCQTHAHLIDTDENKYTVKVLRDMKQKAEENAAKANADIEFFNKYYESKNDDIAELTSIFDKMIAEGNFDLLCSTLGCYSSTITPIFDEVVCRYRIIFDMYCSPDMIQDHINQYLSLPIKSGADQLVELFISLNYGLGASQLIEFCADEDLKKIAALLIGEKLDSEVVCTSAKDFHFECPKGKQRMLNKYIMCVAKQKGIFNLINETGETVSLSFDEIYFKLFYSAFSLVGKMIDRDINFESDPVDPDYQFILQHINVVKQLNRETQSFIWETLLHFLMFSTNEFNKCVTDIPAFVKENCEIEKIIWLHNIKDNPKTICTDDLLVFVEKHQCYSVFVKYLWMMGNEFQNEFLEEHKYLLKKDSHFLQLYTKNCSNCNIYSFLQEYEKYYTNDFLYHCICYTYADLVSKKEHFYWLCENENKLLSEDLFCYLEILSEELRYDLLLRINQHTKSNDAHLYIANQLAKSTETENLNEAKKIYENLLKQSFHKKSLHYNYAVLISNAGKFEDAKKHFQEEYDLYKDASSLHGLLRLRYETNSVIDDSYLNDAKCIPTSDFQWIVAASYVQLQEKNKAKVYYLRTLLLDENLKCAGMLFSLNMDADFANVSDIRKETVCTLVSINKTIKIAIHDSKILRGIIPNNFANCTHLSCDDPSVSSLIYARVNDSVQFESETYIVKEITPLWKYLSAFSFSQIVNDESTIKIRGEKPEDALEQIKSIMIDNRRQLDERLEEYNNLEVSLPLSVFSYYMGKSCLESCEFLALSNSKNISNNPSNIQYSKDNIYILSFDAIVLLAISGMLSKVSTLSNVICPIQVRNQIDSETTVLLNDMESKCSKGSLLLVDGNPRIAQPSDDAKRSRYKYLTELKSFVNSKSATTAYDFNSDEISISGLFSNCNTLIEIGSLGLAQNLQHSILVTDNEFLYSVANIAGVQNVGLCDLIIQLTDNFTDLLEATKKLNKLNFNNYFPSFVFEKMIEYYLETTDYQIQLDCKEKLGNWLLSESDEQEASEHHANVIIQLLKDCLNQSDTSPEIYDLLNHTAIIHFSKLHPEVMQKIISDFWENLKFN